MRVPTPWTSRSSATATCSPAAPRTTCPRSASRSPSCSPPSPRSSRWPSRRDRGPRHCCAGGGRVGQSGRMVSITRSPRVLCVVLAGGKGSRLGPLTEGQAKPSLPVGGHYRLIDISLSNAAHSGLSDVWVLQQYEPHLLNEHLANGRPWDLDRNRGGFRVLPPFQGEGQDGFAGGNADALAENWSIIEAAEPDVLLVCSADHLFR